MGMKKERMADGKSVRGSVGLSGLFVWLFWLNETNQMNLINPANHERPTIGGYDLRLSKS